MGRGCTGVSAAIVMISALGPASAATEPPLTWLNKKADAVAAATEQDKLILLIAGRPTCPICNSVVHGICETTSPAIKQLILAEYVPWFCDVDRSHEYAPYISGMGSFYLPLICLIDPETPDTFLARTNGPQVADTFYAWIKTPLPPPLLSIEQGAESVLLRWDSVPGTPYQPQISLKPAGPWSNLGPPITAAGASTSFADAVTSATARFYRVLQDP